MDSHAADHQVLSFHNREALSLEQPPGELAGLGEQAPDSLLAGRRLYGVIKPRRDPLPGCLGRAEHAVDVPVRLKIDIGDGAVILIGGHQNQAAVAGFPMRPLGGPGLRGPGPELGSRVIRERYLSDRAEEDVGQTGRVTRIVGADGDFHPANVTACPRAGRAIRP